MTRYNMSAGVLPITRDAQGTVLFLVGRDIRDNAFSDFGGKSERVDDGDPANTAIREFYEETLGCICNHPQDMKYRLLHSSIVMKGETRNRNEYVMYVLEIPFTKNINDQFMKTMHFMKYKNIGTNLIEKKELAWVTLRELIKMPKREVFRDTLERNMKMLRRIVSEPWRSVCTPAADAEEPEDAEGW